MRGGEPFQACDFGRVGLKGAGVSRAVEPDELLVGLWAGGKVFDFRKVLAGGGGDTDLFGNLPVHGDIVLLAGVDVAADTGSPATGFAIFAQRPLLQEETAIGVKKPKVDGTVEKTLGMNLGARGGADDAILRIDNIKLFVGWIHKEYAIR